MSEWMPGHGPQMCTSGHSHARTCSRSAVLVPLLCVILRLEMPRFRGSWQGGIMPLEMTSGMNDILWEERMTSLPSQCPSSPRPLPTSSPDALLGRNDAITAGGGGIPGTAGMRGGRGCRVETAAFPETKEPFKVTWYHVFLPWASAKPASSYLGAAVPAETCVCSP